MRWRQGLPNKIKIVDSIQAALPYQVERKTYKNFDENMLLRICPKICVFRRKEIEFVIQLFFWSMPQDHQHRKRLGEAKGAVELLLAECYIRRDEVALISFREKHSDYY